MYAIQIIPSQGTPALYRYRGVVRLYVTGRNAAKTAALLSSRRTSGEKYRVIRQEEGQKVDWRKREQNRFRDGTYTRLPWQMETWWTISTMKGPFFDHSMHVALDDPTMVAFNKSEEDGERDKQTRMKPGAYLKRYFPSLDDETVRHWAMVMAGTAKHELKFATTEEEILHVYEKGPSSCMRFPERDSGYRVGDKPYHPVRVYAAGDLAVAYLLLGKRITARCVCWPAKKRYSRIYGDSVRLEAMLGEKGFKRGSFAGAKLLKVGDIRRCDCGDAACRQICKAIHGAILPFLGDNAASNVRIADTHLVLYE